jgi:hypothetical protein
MMPATGAKNASIDAEMYAKVDFILRNIYSVHDHWGTGVTPIIRQPQISQQGLHFGIVILNVKAALFVSIFFVDRGYVV